MAKSSIYIEGCCTVHVSSAKIKLYCVPYVIDIQLVFRHTVVLVDQICRSFF